MSLILERCDIVDRDKEVKRIEQIIRENKENKTSHAIMVWADSGYGKSAILQKVKTAFVDDSINIIIVETPPTNAATSVEGQFLNYVAEAIDHDMRNKFALDDFLYSSLSTMQPIIDTDLILQSGHSIKSSMVAKLGQIAFSDLKAKRLLYDTSTDSLIVLRDYIETAIYSENIILDITNAQNIDATSFRIINSILQDLSNITIIFEYTTKNQNSCDMYHFAEKLHCPCTTIEIDMLPFDFALSIIGIPNNQNKIYEIERFYHEVVKGNLYRIIQAKADSSDYEIMYDEEPIERKIQSLGYAQKLLLVIICLHDGQIDLTTFNDILHLVRKSFYIPENWETELESLILQKENQIKLRHASITDAISLSLDNAAVATAYHYLVKYYEAQKCAKMNPLKCNQAVVQLVKLHSRFAPIRMLPLLEEFKQVVIGKLSEDDAYTLIKQAFDALGNKQESEYHFKLIALCYESGFYSGALELLKSLGKLYTECGQVLLCMLLNRNDYHAKAIEQCKSLLRTVKNSRYKIIVSMIKMLSERSLNLISDCQATFKKIEKNNGYKPLLEYGFFLRNAQIILSYKESLSYLQCSIDFFEQRGEFRYAAHSRLTYAVQCARLGYLQQSTKIMDEITPILTNTSFEKHIVYLNQASIRLLSGIADEKTDRLLDKALITATTVFDRVSILNDMICSIILKGKTSGDFDHLMEKLVTESEREPDYQLRRRSYTNIYLYYRMIGDKIQSGYWRSMASSIIIKKAKQTIEDIFLFDEVPNEDMRFLATKPFCVSFITYWHFDIPLLGL